MLLANRLAVPDNTAGLLLDLDGVILDTLGLDFELVGRLLGSEGLDVEVPKRVIREYFPYAIPDFWRALSNQYGLRFPADAIDRLVSKHEQARREAKFAVHEGIREILAAAREEASLSTAVVSNNGAADIKNLLQAANLEFDIVVGNDEPGLRRKPAPDCYVLAASRLNLAPEACAAIEDSLVGAEAASRAGCFTVGVATGANSFDELSASTYVSRSYTSFIESAVALGRDGVTNKILESPNDFVSHMIEHIAWRLGCSINLSWPNDDWRDLGGAIGREVGRYAGELDRGGALGMIDDGSSEITIERSSSPGNVSFSASPQVDLDWFISCRVEQLQNGRPLVDLLGGLAAATNCNIDILVAAFEDPHHTWESIFRGVGVAFNEMAGPSSAAPAPQRDVRPSAGSASSSTEPSGEKPVERGWVVLDASVTNARLLRETAESRVAVAAALGTPTVRYKAEVGDTIFVDGLEDLLGCFAKGAGMSLEVCFEATRLTSSHVVAEDVGLVLGRTMRCLALERMTEVGIQGAGSNMRAEQSGPVRVGVSIEGRKFWKYVPMDQNYDSFRRSFLIGHTLSNGLFTEDLDDFIDGLAGGMQSSIVIHLDSRIGPLVGWPKIFVGLGHAIADALSANPERRGLIPGVKATLA